MSTDATHVVDLTREQLRRRLDGMNDDAFFAELGAHSERLRLFTEQMEALSKEADVFSQEATRRTTEA
jgi:hypothetical protein